MEAWEEIKKSYSDDFEWIIGVTWLSHPLIILGTMMAYVVMAYAIKFLNRWPRKITPIKFLHNAFLCLFSLIMFVNIVYEVFTAVQKDNASAYDMICDPEQRYNKGKIYFWIWVFHLSKWYEFIDTLILVIEGGRLQFLHVYHHTLTFFITWLALHLGATCQWVGMMLNTGVHVIMYCYYAMKTLGRDPWWKKQLTQLQITQFGINIFVGLVWFYWSKESDCSGDIYSIGLTLFANVTFMLLFIEMYKKIHIEKDKIH